MESLSIARPVVLAASWLAVGLLVARGGHRPPSEWLLAVFFWPFFFGSRGRKPTDRLARALGDTPGGAELIVELDVAICRLSGRIEALDRAVAEASPESAQLVLTARARTQRDLAEAIRAIEDAAIRLTLMEESSDHVEVENLLASLRQRLAATEEVVGST